MAGKRRPLLDVLDAGELLATLRNDRHAPALTLTRPYGLTAVRRVARILTGRSQPLSASREDLAHAIEEAMNDHRPARTRPGRRRRNTSPEACRAALGV